jgi:serine/threonine protein kinase
VAQEISAIADGVPETDAASPPEETGPAALSPGTRLGAYLIGRRIGVGSMGAVYEGARVANGNPVAIKVLAADLAAKPVARARFLNEAKLAARITHPHVVAIIDSGEDSERVYLVMDLLEGEDLARRLHRSGPMSVGEVVDILGPICDALASAHRGGVTHRDLKPSNIFLAVREGRLHPMLLDFGVATDDVGMSEGDAPGPLTWKGVGTPMYLAPELVADHRAAGPLSDEYALGAILYETLTGEPPYAADDLQQLLQRIAAGHPPSARTRRPEISAELDAVVRRAMSADPKWRFPSVENLGRALRRFAASPAERQRLRRHRPPSSPAIDLEMATPSPFVRTLVPEHKAESGPWFVAPDATDELSDEAKTWSELQRTEAAGSRIKDDGPADLDDSPEEGPPVPPARAFFRVDWQAVSSFATKQRRVVVASGIAVLGITLLFVVRGGRSVSEPRSAPSTTAPAQTASPEPTAPARAIPRGAAEAEPRPAAPPAAVDKSVAAPADPVTPPATVDKSATAPASPVTPPAAVEKSVAAPPSPAPAPATVEKREVAPTRPAAPTISARADDASQERPKAAVRRERPVSARAELPIPKAVVSPAPASTPHLRESAPVRMHNGVPLLD